MKIILVLFSIFALISGLVSAASKSSCSQLKQIGPCYNYDMVYYYDINFKACKIFFYSGCGGNDNRFVTKEECEQLCLKNKKKKVG